MDEAVSVSIGGLRAEVGQVRHDISEVRDDLKIHVKDDREAIAGLHDSLAGIKEQVSRWSGQIQLIAWLAGAILTALIVQIVHTWKP